MWTERTPGISPPAWYHNAMVYDRARQLVLLFGGGYSGTHGDTWEWDGLRWTRLAPEVSPPARWGHALAYDSVRGRVVLFGGRDVETDLSDTWEWDGEEWIQRTPEVSPPARWNHALAFDSARERVVLFGGLSGSPDPPSQTFLFGDTWEWDGEEWIQRTPEVSPPARRGHGLAYDSARNRTVLYGGIYGIASSNETWEWDGSEWLQRNSLPYFGTHDITLVYDSHRELVLFFGGYQGGPWAADIWQDVTWEWNGSDWAVQVPDGPTGRSGYGLAYDRARREVVLFGGWRRSWLRDTWVYRLLAETLCDGVDDDGNGQVDEGCDDDGDGYCDAGMTIVDSPAVCPNGGGDCDDGDSAIHPGAADLPGDSLDQDCDGAPACDPDAQWRNHGQFVSCVARECAWLVDEGAVSREECTQLIRSAAHSPGRR